MDVLDNEPNRETKRSPWLARLAGGVAAIAVTLAVLPTLLGDLDESSEIAAVPTATPLDVIGTPDPSGSSSPTPTLLPQTVTNAHVLLAGDQLRILDVDGGHTHTLFLPQSYGSARPGGVLRLADVTVVLARPSSGIAPGLNSEAFVVQDGGSTIPLGIAAGVVAASGDAVWLTRRGDSGRSIRLVGTDGVERLGPRALPPDMRLLIGGHPTVLLGPAPGDRPSRIVDWDPVTEEVVTVLTEHGLIHDADARTILWQECSACPLRTTGRDGSSTASVAPLPGGWRLTGRARLSPDGRHWSAVVATKTSPNRRAVVIGHLPGTRYADSVSVVLDDLPAVGRAGGPRLAWSASGWLFVSTGYSLWAVSPGPHQAFTLDAPDHDSIAAW